MAKILQQSDFDKFVSEGKENDGMSTAAAVVDVLEMFEGTEYNLSGLFIYKTDEEYFLKSRLEENLKTVATASQNAETFVNASFAIQGIQQALSDDRQCSHVVQGCWRLCEAFGYLQTLTLLLNVDEEVSDDDDNDQDDDADDKRVNIILNAMLSFIAGESQRFRDKMLALTLTEESATALIESLKRSLTEEHTIAKYITCTLAFLQQSDNIPLLSAACTAHGGAVEIFGCAPRFHKENIQLGADVQKVMLALQL